MNGSDDATVTDFTNASVDVGALPRLDSQAFNALDPAYARVRTLAAVAVGAAVVLATTAATIMSGSIVAVVAGALALGLVAVAGVVNRIEVDHMGYLVRDHDLSFSSGVIARSVATVPFARVQHVSIERGPIDRRFGLASVQLRTAGGGVSIPGLTDDLAERLKQLVADRAGELADAEIDDDSNR